MERMIFNIYVNILSKKLGILIYKLVTIKKEHNIDFKNDAYLTDMLNKFGNVVRFSYSRIIKDGVEELKDLEKVVKTTMNNIESLDASWVKCAVKLSTELDTDNKIYFGGKSNFFKRKYKKDFDTEGNIPEKMVKKLIPMSMRGACGDPNGNRKAKLIDYKTFLFKPKRGVKYEIDLSNQLSKNEKAMLKIISEEANDNKNYFNFRIDEKYLYITFNEPVLIDEETKYTAKKNRFLGIDLNPNYIAVAVMDINEYRVKTVTRKLFCLKKLNNADNKDKKRYELTQVNKKIVDFCKSYHVEYVTLEDITIKSSNKGKGKGYNKLINNTWLRRYLINNLKKTLNINDIKHLEIESYFTSFIGQMKNPDDYDSVAAAKEVAYRGFMKSIGKDTYKDMWSYINDFLDSPLTTRWKNKLAVTFRDLYDRSKQKKAKYSYRLFFTDSEKSKWSVLRLKSYKSMIDLLTF